jgi:hypothetical protein
MWDRFPIPLGFGAYDSRSEYLLWAVVDSEPAVKDCGPAVFTYFLLQGLPVVPPHLNYEYLVWGHRENDSMKSITFH